jgi:hypothetical protein
LTPISKVNGLPMIGRLLDMGEAGGKAVQPDRREADAHELVRIVPCVVVGALVRCLV